MRRVRRHLSYANVTATICLFLVLAGGAAYAVDKINSHEITNNSIKSIDLRNRKAVKAIDVRPNTLTGR
jgi:septal ring-binding cell division protein DamX